jgi:hypothetical protein
MQKLERLLAKIPREELAKAQAQQDAVTTSRIFQDAVLADKE